MPERQPSAEADSSRITRDATSQADLQSRELRHTRPNPLTLDQARGLRESRPAGPPRPCTEPVRVVRRTTTLPVRNIKADRRARS
jgi:hypothetical protein